MGWCFQSAALSAYASHPQYSSLLTGTSDRSLAFAVHNYYVVASGWGEFIDGAGEDVPPMASLLSQPDATVNFAELDLDAAFVNFNSGGATAGHHVASSFLSSSFVCNIMLYSSSLQHVS